MASYTVSGCIVTYNNMKSIRDTLDSLFKYTTDIDFKLFIVDNGSTDGTVEFIRKNYPQAEIINSGKNIGFGAGHNLVLPKLQSKYHVIINPDILIRDNVIKKMAEHMDSNSDIGMLSPKICFPDGRLQILGKRKPKLKYLIASRMRNDDNPSRLLREYAMLDCDLDSEMDIEVASGCFMFIKTSLFKNLGGFDDRYFMYFEDFDLSRMVNNVSRVQYYPKAVIYHVWGRDSKRDTKLKIIHIQSMLKYYMKWLFK